LCENEGVAIPLENMEERRGGNEKGRRKTDINLQYQLLEEFRHLRRDLNRLWTVILILLAANLGVNFSESQLISHTQNWVHDASLRNGNIYSE